MSQKFTKTEIKPSLNDYQTKEQLIKAFDNAKENVSGISVLNEEFLEAAEVLIRRDSKSSNKIIMVRYDSHNGVESATFEMENKIFYYVFTYYASSQTYWFTRYIKDRKVNITKSALQDILEKD